MNIIRDEASFGMLMIPLFVDWNVRRCNVKDCVAKPTTIISQLGDDIPLVGMCEEHFQEGNQPNGKTFTFEWDDYDAFKMENT